MNERRFHSNIERLRSAERIDRIEIDKVITLCLDNLVAENVLDVGTGSGLFAEKFCAKGLKVAGIDINPEMIEAARNYVPSGDFKVSAAEIIPYPDKSFDLVFLGHVLHEVDDYLKTLKQARRVCRKRLGILEWIYQQQEFGPPLHHRIKHDDVNLYAKQAGFDDIKLIELGHMILYLLA